LQYYVKRNEYGEQSERHFVEEEPKPPHDLKDDFKDRLKHYPNDSVDTATAKIVKNALKASLF
jgi:hypothetical protein